MSRMAKAYGRLFYFKNLSANWVCWSFFTTKCFGEFFSTVKTARDVHPSAKKNTNLTVKIRDNDLFVLFCWLCCCKIMFSFSQTECIAKRYEPHDFHILCLQHSHLLYSAFVHMSQKSWILESLYESQIRQPLTVLSSMFGSELEISCLLCSAFHGFGIEHSYVCLGFDENDEPRTTVVTMMEKMSLTSAKVCRSTRH